MKTTRATAVTAKVIRINTMTTTITTITITGNLRSTMRQALRRGVKQFCSLKRCGVCYKTDNNTTHVLTSFRVIQETWKCLVCQPGLFIVIVFNKSIVLCFQAASSSCRVVKLKLPNNYVPPQQNQQQTQYQQDHRNNNITKSQQRYRNMQRQHKTTNNNDNIKTQYSNNTTRHYINHLVGQKLAHNTWTKNEVMFPRHETDITS